MINFIPNDPRAAGAPPMHRVSARPDRPANRAGFTVAGNEPQAVLPPGTPGFVRWQARQAALLTLGAWEAALGAPITSWSTGVANPKSLTIEPDRGDDLNAYYDRESLSFFHHQTGTTMTFSGASADVVSHEAGHAVLDAIRPDLWDTPYLEVGGFHEAFGDVTAIVTALSDLATRKALLAASPDLGTANFVEATAEDLSNAVRLALGATHPAAKPRRALNTFQLAAPQHDADVRWPRRHDRRGPQHRPHHLGLLLRRSSGDVHRVGDPHAGAAVDGHEAGRPALPPGCRHRARGAPVLPVGRAGDGDGR